ncbi:MAG: dihydrolipoyl dehydrogenase, partial [Myxococcota bacterium]
TYCHPEVASIGMNEDQVKEKKLDYQVGRFPFSANGRARTSGETDGFVKIIRDKKYGEILGAHIVGNRACDMIAEFVDTIALEGGYQELARIVHPHPTISEAVLDAARAVDGWATHQ